MVIDLTETTVIHRDDASALENTAVEILVEEVEKRTGVRWKTSSDWPASGSVVVILVGQTMEVAGHRGPKGSGADLPEHVPEGYRLLGRAGPPGEVWITAARGRGAIFGAGNLLRMLRMTPGSATLEGEIDIATSPVYPMRGHQLGYRDRANSWDAWSVEQFEQYIRELMIFGNNAIENIPFQGKPSGPLMKLTRREMNIKISEICEKYDVDYWLWIPAEVDLGEENLRATELKKHEQIYADCPRLNGIFFPGGDPGSNPPELVLPFLKDVSEILARHHPDAGIYFSLQGFKRDQVEYVFERVERERPDWLTGIVGGPSSPPLSMMRERLPVRYKLRDYPDITHTVRCQYEVEWWDQAYALTLGREACNPQPLYYAYIHGRTAAYTCGFISYSDGVHDDVNKVVWTRLGWTPDEEPDEILLEYCQFFFGPEVAESAADGIRELERNWMGALAENESVEETLGYWQRLERRFPDLARNWRWQLCLLRANYDAYTRRRLIHEQQLEKEAMGVLGNVDELGIEGAMEKALSIVDRADSHTFCKDLRTRIEELCDDLFRTVGLQTSVGKHKAAGPERGAVLDFVDYPLNNRWWLRDEFEKIRNMPDEDKRGRLETIRTWENPGPGSFYDDVGNVANSPHLERGFHIAPGYAWWDQGLSRARLSSQVYMNRPKLRYEELDPRARYMVRVAGSGDALLEVNGQRITPTLYEKEDEGFKEFPVPPELLETGSIELTFADPGEQHLNWRQRSRVSDVWVLRL